MDLFTSTEFLVRALDGTSMRVQALANNKAHSGDPSYRSESVSFEEHMQDALQQWNAGDTDADREAGEKEAATLQPTVEYGAPGEKDLQEGMANMAKAQIMYQALTARVSTNFSMLKYAIDNSGH